MSSINKVTLNLSPDMWGVGSSCIHLSHSQSSQRQLSLANPLVSGFSPLVAWFTLQRTEVQVHTGLGNGPESFGQGILG